MSSFINRHFDRVHLTFFRLRAVLPKCGAYVKRVVFNSSVHSVQLSLIERYCPNLTSLEVRVGLVNDQLHLIGTKLGTRLKCLSLSRIFPDEEFVLERLLGRCSLLGELSIGPNDLQGGFIRGLFPCDQLKILSLHLCSGLSLVLAKFLMQMANRLVGLELINWDFRNCPDFFAPFKRLTVVKVYLGLQCLSTTLTLFLSCSRCQE